jgi:ABC-type branched-subunit amino acid transport system substrate-binding protein
LGTGAGVASLLAGCSNFSFGPNNITTRNTANAPARDQITGTGTVKVALILPLTGDVASVGTSMANGAQLAIDYIQSNAQIENNISLLVKDSQSDAGMASRQASAAVSEGASLILGPLKADSVRAAGAVARSAGIPLIGFSNNSGAASPGVYLLNVLPETEVRRSLAYAQSQGRRAFAAVVPTTDFGRIQEVAFQQAVSDLGLNARAVYTFSNETEARSALDQVAQQIKAGAIDALFLPDRATAPSFGVLLETATIDRSKMTIMGSADWDNDIKIASTAFLTGAVYPAVDDAGMNALRPNYVARFGGEPHAFASIAYTAVLLANSATLSMATPPYSAALLTRASGFNGRDGLFRFLPDGRCQYALVMKQVVVGGAQKVDSAKLP